MKTILKLCRIHQYPKNLFVMLPLFFSGNLLEPERLWPAVWTMVAFCLIASGVYIFNDWMDIDLDKQHPVKKYRPLANGSWIQPYAFFLMIFLLIVGCLIAYWVNWSVLLICGLYIVLMVFYSVILKHLAVVDLLMIGVAYILRLLAGAFAANVSLSPYIVMMTFFLALFLGLGKRHHEFLYCQEKNIPTRPALAGYSARLFDIATAIVMALIIVEYFMYTVLSHSPAAMKSSYLYLTTFFVIGGSMRYLQLIYVKKSAEDPAFLLFHDRILLVTVLAWAVSLGVILYG